MTSPTPTAVRATHDPFAPPVRFPRERLLRALDEETVGRLEGRFATLSYADARTWAEARRTVSNDDLRALYAVPDDATVESLQERLRDDLVELAVALGASNVSGTKEELSRAILEAPSVVEQREQAAAKAAETKAAETKAAEEAAAAAAAAPTTDAATTDTAPDETADEVEAEGGDDARQADGPAIDGTEGADGVPATGDPTERPDGEGTTAEGTTEADSAAAVEGTDAAPTTSAARRRR